MLVHALGVGISLLEVGEPELSVDVGGTVQAVGKSAVDSHKGMPEEFVGLAVALVGFHKRAGIADEVGDDIAYSVLLPVDGTLYAVGDVEVDASDKVALVFLQSGDGLVNSRLLLFLCIAPEAFDDFGEGLHILRVGEFGNKVIDFHGASFLLWGGTIPYLLQEFCFFCRLPGCLWYSHFILYLLVVLVRYHLLLHPFAVAINRRLRNHPQWLLEIVL